MKFRFRKTRVTTAEQPELSGGWYADPYGGAARRWHDNTQGWTDRVQGAGLEPDKTGMARVDEASINAATEHPDPFTDPDSDAVKRSAASAAVDSGSGPQGSAGTPTP